MSGDTSKAALWADADVYIAAVDAELPTDVDDAFGVDWDLIGLLDGDTGFEHSGDFQSKDDFYAWGGILVRTARRNWKQQVKFTALENNDTVVGLFSPYEVPDPHFPFLLALETREGEVVHRVITKNHAEVDARENLKLSESELQKYGFTCTIYPDSDGVLWTPQDTAVESS